MSSTHPPPPLLIGHRQDRSFNLAFLKEEANIGPEQIEALYQYAKFQFDCGNYSMASELLSVRAAPVPHACMDVV